MSLSLPDSVHGTLISKYTVINIIERLSLTNIGIGNSDLDYGVRVSYRIRWGDWQERLQWLLHQIARNRHRPRIRCCFQAPMDIDQDERIIDQTSASLNSLFRSPCTQRLLRSCSSRVQPPSCADQNPSEFFVHASPTIFSEHIRTPKPFNWTNTALSPRSPATTWAPARVVMGSYCRHDLLVSLSLSGTATQYSQRSRPLGSY